MVMLSRFFRLSVTLILHKFLNSSGRTLLVVTLTICKAKSPAEIDHYVQINFHYLENLVNGTSSCRKSRRFASPQIQSRFMPSSH